MMPCVAPVLAASTIMAGFTLCARWYARRHAVALSLRSPVVAAILFAAIAANAALVFLRNPWPREMILLMGLSSAAVCAATDAACGYIFDIVTLPALAMLLMLAWAAGEAFAAIAGALAAGGALALLYAATRGRGLGLGDVKLACCIGAALGAFDAIRALGIAFVAGGCYAAVLLLFRRASRGDAIRFAPYLAAGTAVMAFIRSAQ